MRKILTTTAAAVAIMGASAQESQPTTLWRAAAILITEAGVIKTLIEIYDWVMAKWRPDWKPGDLWHCPYCRFSRVGSSPTMVDHSLGNSFIQSIFPGRQWHVGQQLVVCNGTTCFRFEYTGSGFFAAGSSFDDPHVGYANPASVPSAGVSGPGESGFSGGGTGPGVSLPNVIYNPAPRTGHVTITPGPFHDGGGSGANDLRIYYDTE